MSKLYLVYGANGAQGGAVASALLASGDRIRVVLRSIERNPFSGNPNAQVVIGDLADKASLLEASHEVDGVSFVMPLNYDKETAIQWGRNAIDAAVEAGAPALVFNTSSVVSTQPTGVVAIDIKVALEEYLARAPIPSIVLRPTVYNGNLIAPWSIPAIVEQGVVAYPVPADLRVSWISWEEMAGYTVAALKRPELAERKPVFQVGGAEALTGPELARQLEAVVGRPLQYVAIGLEQFEAGLNASLGVPVGTEIARFYGWMADPRNGNPLDVNLRPVREELSVPQTSVAEWAKQVRWTQLSR